MNIEKIERYIWDNIDDLLDEADKWCWHPWGYEWRKLVKKLGQELPLKHSDGTKGEDLIHWRWATALQALLYLGSLLEQKRRNPEL